MTEPQISSINGIKAKVFIISNSRDVGFGTSNELGQHLNGTINGPLVHSDNSFVGGCINNNIQVSDWILNPTAEGGNFANHTGIFGCDKNGKMFLVESSDNPFITPNNTEWAFQNGPILLEEGQNSCNPNGTSRNIRSGIGYNDKGQLVAIVSEDKVTFFEFGELFRKMGCKNAIYLDGSPDKANNDYVGYSMPFAQDGMMENRPVMQFFHSTINQVNLNEQ